MKYFKIALVFVFMLTLVSHSDAQLGKKISVKWYSSMRKLKISPWVFGIGWNIVDDNGRKTTKIFDVHDSWNLPGYPSSIRVEKYFDKGFSFVFQGSYNQYKGFKHINSDQPSLYNATFISMDLNGKYNLCELYNINAKWFNSQENILDCYLAHGWGYTYRNTTNFGGGVATCNLGFGMHVWIYEGFGINLEAMAKFGLQAPLIQTGTNYAQYNFGIVYQLIPKSERGAHGQRAHFN